MLLYFELEKKIGNNFFEGNKKNKTIIRWVFVNFKKTYFQILYNQKWKMLNFANLKCKNIDKLVEL